MPNKAKEKNIPLTEDENLARGPHDPMVPDESQQTSTGSGKETDY